MDEKNMQFANFNITFGEQDRPMTLLMLWKTLMKFFLLFFQKTQGVEIF